MRHPRHLADRRVGFEEPEEIPWSAASRAHRRAMNLAACDRIRAGLGGSNSLPEILELIDGGSGPPSAVIEVPVFDANAERDAAKWDRQARDSTGKYVRSLRK
jgi:hypothetical protein